MRHVLPLFSRAALLATVTAISGIPSALAMDAGSTGADGAFNPTVNTEVQLPESGILNYTTVNIPAGITVRFKKNSANTPAYLLASGDVVIAGNLDVAGEDAKPTGTYGDGILGDDAIPGSGGPGGYTGGRGGRDDTQQRAAVIRGGAGLGPGGGPGGIEGNDGCSPLGYYKYVGIGGAHAANTYRYSGGCSNTPSAFGKNYGSSLLQPLAGGSGGGGGRGGTAYPGSGGGGGGGAILIASSGTLRVTGAINARGGDGGGILGAGIGGQGAGGSGGAIRLMATRVEGNGSLLAEGGCIHYNNNGRQRCTYDGGNGQGGSPGRIRIEAEAITFSGTSAPAYVRDIPGAVFIAGAPTLRIVSVGGQAVPAETTGIADVVLPASASEGPLQIGFETRNVPVGNVVNLRAVPAYGTAVEAASPAIEGTAAVGTAQASITLPAGPSTLQATTTYTVIVAALNDEALGDRLSRLAQNERVEKVEVTVSMDGGATAKLITASGRSFDLPYTDIAAVGFRG
ncbi:hypothetical protein [Pseudoxanthomonas sp. UTMC 1351]|uniref:hypothetical protein n=1 Tax=Pseudoxanthomonas sp. UTMC 1351 TaxID=2695853 RepID=UPI0034CF4CC2